MTTLKNYRTIRGGRIYDAYFNAELFKLDIDFKGAFGDKSKDYIKSIDCFVSGGKVYAVRGVDHFNAHISGWQNPNAIYSLKIAQVEFGAYGRLKELAIINAYS